MKIKVQPEDFRVREELDLTLKAAGPYRVYMLHKRGWNTLDAVRAGARASGIPAHEVRYAGLKDRHAVTSQYVSVPASYSLVSGVPGVSQEDLAFEAIGFADDFVSTRNLVGNAFEIVLRSLSDSEASAIGSRLKSVRASGYPNYFDDQRFGSVPPGGELLAERVLRGHLRGALKLYMAAEDQETLAKTRIAEILKQGGNKKNLLLALNSIPHEEMALHFAAFQAALWNQTLTTLLDPLADPGTTVTVPGRLGDYLFPAELSGVQGLDIPTVARKMLPCAPEVASAIDTVLAAFGIGARDLNLRGIRNVYLKSFCRSATVVPGGLLAGECLPDEFYAGRTKVALSFSLPRGSYATMLIKALTGQTVGT